MVVIGLILGIVYSRMVQDSIYAYFNDLVELPAYLVKLEGMLHLTQGSMMQVFKSTVAIVMLGLVPALIVVGCLLLQFLVEAAFETRRVRKRARMKAANA